MNYTIDPKLGIGKILNMDFYERAEYIQNLTEEAELFFYKYLLHTNFTNKNLLSGFSRIYDVINEKTEKHLAMANILYDVISKEVEKMTGIKNPRMSEIKVFGTFREDGEEYEEALTNCEQFSRKRYAEYIAGLVNERWDVLEFANNYSIPKEQRVYTLCAAKVVTHNLNRWQLVSPSEYSLYYVKGIKTYLETDGACSEKLNSLIREMDKHINCARVLQMMYCILKDKESIKKELLLEPIDNNDDCIVQKIRILEYKVTVRRKKNNKREC